MHLTELIGCLTPLAQLVVDTQLATAREQHVRAALDARVVTARVQDGRNVAC